MHAAQIYAELLGQVCHKIQFLGHLDGKQEVHTLSLSVRSHNYDQLRKTANFRHSYSMLDIAHFISSMLHSPILTSTISPDMGPITGLESVIPISSQSNIPSHLECGNHRTRPPFSGYLRMSYVIPSPGIMTLAIFPRMNGIHIGVRRLV